jgi:tight adherence protein B
MGIIIGVGIFITIVLLIEASYGVFETVRDSESRRIKKRLRTLSAGGYSIKDIKDIDIVRKRILSEVPWLNRLLLRITRKQDIDRLLEQANSKMPLGFFLLLSLCLASVGYAAGFLLLKMNYLLAIIPSGLLGIIPLLYLLSRKQQRMKRFQEQLPDALDLIARALKAGHAFSGGLNMVAGEFSDPIGTEFDKTRDEISFGVGINEAMKNLAARVDCPDLQFFVVSVIIQRETGGNLAEILEKIAYLIRERFKLYGRVRALAADGKLSAIILVALPPFIAFYMSIVNPEYIGLLVTDPIGIAMTICALLMMTMGVLVMKRMVSIKV